MPEIKNSIMSNSMLYTKEGICSEPEDQNKYPNWSTMGKKEQGRKKHKKPVDTLKRTNMWNYNL